MMGTYFGMATAVILMIASLIISKLLEKEEKKGKL